MKIFSKTKNKKLLVIGQTVYIRVGGYGSDTGSYVFNLTLSTG